MGKDILKKQEDLITRYIVEKIRNGYKVESTRLEIINFLKVASKWNDGNTGTFDFLQENNVVFNYDAFLDDYFKGNNSKEKVINKKTKKYEYVEGVKQTQEGLIVPTYDLKNHSHIYEKNFNKAREMRMFFDFYMSRCCEKREINTNISIDDDVKFFSTSATAALAIEVWENRIKKYIETNHWPSQCTDVNEFVLDTDLASIINLPPMREELINFYNVVSSNIMAVSLGDDNFKMTNFEDEVLAKSNFDLVTKSLRLRDYVFATKGKAQEAVEIVKKENRMGKILDRELYPDYILYTDLDSPKVLSLVQKIEKHRR